MSATTSDETTGRFAAAWTIVTKAPRGLKRAITNGQVKVLKSSKNVFTGYDRQSAVWGIGALAGIAVATCVVAAVGLVNLIIVAALMSFSVYLGYAWLGVSVIAILSWAYALVGSIIDNLKLIWDSIQFRRRMTTDSEGFISDLTAHLHSVVDAPDEEESENVSPGGEKKEEKGYDFLIGLSETLPDLGGLLG